jgi:isoquinoline 1-oxidoreductase subunit alpha
MKLTINGKPTEVNVGDDMPLLWVLRDELNLTGTKFSCGIEQCGACMVHVDGKAVPSCKLPASTVTKNKITTIEGLGDNGLHPVQQAWIDEAVSQCGYCQSGQLMRAAQLLAENPKPTEDDVRQALDRNLCRCGTYPRIVSAVLRAAKAMAK